MEGQSTAKGKVQQAVKALQAGAAAQKTATLPGGGKKSEPPEPRFIKLNEGSTQWTAEERKLLVQKFDLLKFETRVRELIGEAVTPVAGDQQEILKRQDLLFRDHSLLSCKIQEGAEELRRSNEIIKELKRFDKDVQAISKKFQDHKATTDNNQEATFRSLNEAKTDLKAVRLELELCQSQCRRALAHNGVDTKQLSYMIEKYKDEMQSYLKEYSESLIQEMGRVDENYAQAEARAIEVTEKYSVCHTFMEEQDVRVQECQRSIDGFYKQIESLKAVHKYGPRLDHLENETRQVRLLCQQSILDTKRALSNALCRREVEETILKFNFEMLDETFGEKLVEEYGANVDIRSQIKVNCAKWKILMRERYDLGRFADDPMISSIYRGVPLPTLGELRKGYLDRDLAKSKLYNDVSKFTRWGNIRSNSFDAVPNAPHSIPQKTLRERPVGRREFLCRKPKNYRPRYLPRRRKVTFEEPVVEEVEAEGKDGHADSGEAADDSRTQGQESGTGAPSKVDEEAANEAQAKARQAALLKYTEELREAEEEAKYEVWRGQRLPTTLGVVHRKYNLKRQHSNEGRGTRLLLHGRRFEALFEDFKDRNVMEVRDGKKMTKEAFLQAKLEQAVGELQPKAPPTKTSLLTPLVAPTPIPTPVAAAPPPIELPPPQPTPRAETVRKRKMTAEELDNEVVRWGEQTMTRLPPAPQGMQFVNVNELVDFSDLEEFKCKLVATMETDFSHRFEYFAKKNLADLQASIAVVQQHLQEKQVEILEENRELIRVSQGQLMARTEDQDARIKELKAYAQEESYLTKCEVARKFVEQAGLNESLDGRLQSVVKKMHIIKSDVGITCEQLSKYVGQVEEQNSYQASQFNKLLLMIKTMVDLLFLECELQLQDEADRHHMSLWSLQPAKPSDPPPEPIREPYQRGHAIQLDEDCLSCSLDKYRPTIKQAFKMACIQYKPSDVPLSGKRYERRQLIEAKEKMLSESWFSTIGSIDYLQRLFQVSQQMTHEKQRECFMRLLDQRLQSGSIQANDVDFGMVDDLVLDESIRDNIIRNPSNIGLLYSKAKDDVSLQIFRHDFENQSFKSVKNLNQKSSIVSIMTQDSRAKQINQRTQILIDKLKGQQTLKNRKSVLVERVSDSARQWRRRSQGDVQPAEIPPELVGNLKVFKLEKPEIDNEPKKISLSSKKETLKLAEERNKAYAHSTSRNVISQVKETEISFEDMTETIQNDFNQKSKYNIDIGLDVSLDQGGQTPTQRNQSRFNNNSSMHKPILSLEKSGTTKRNEANRSSLPVIQLKKIHDSQGYFSQQVNQDELDDNDQHHRLEHRHDAVSETQEQRFQMHVKTTSRRRAGIGQVIDLPQRDYDPNTSNADSNRKSTARKRQQRIDELAKQKEQGKLSRNIREALTMLNTGQKKQLLAECKSNSKALKQLDNIAVKGNLKGLRQLGKNAWPGAGRGDAETPMQLQINALEAVKGKQGHGYLYSQGRHGLMDDVRAPFQNQEKSPIKSLQEIYQTKNRHVLGQQAAQVFRRIAEDQADLAGPTSPQTLMHKSTQRNRQMQTSFVQSSEHKDKDQFELEEAETLHDSPSNRHIDGDSTKGITGKLTKSRQSVVINDKGFNLLHKDMAKDITAGETAFDQQYVTAAEDRRDKKISKQALHLKAADHKNQKDQKSINQMGRNVSLEHSVQKQKQQNMDYIRNHSKVDPRQLAAQIDGSLKVSRLREEEQKRRDAAFLYPVRPGGSIAESEALYDQAQLARPKEDHGRFIREIEGRNLDRGQAAIEMKNQYKNYKVRFTSTQEALLDFDKFHIDSNDYLEGTHTGRPLKSNATPGQDPGAQSLASSRPLKSKESRNSHSKLRLSSKASGEKDETHTKLRNFQEGTHLQVRGEQSRLSSKARDMTPQPESAPQREHYFEQQPGDAKQPLEESASSRAKRAFQIKKKECSNEMGSSTQSWRRPDSSAASLGQIVGFADPNENTESNFRVSQKKQQRM